MKKKLAIVLILCMMVAMIAACGKDAVNSATRTKIIRTILVTQEKTPAVDNTTPAPTVTSTPTVVPTTAPTTTKVPTATPTNKPTNTLSAVVPTNKPTPTPVKTQEINPVVKLNDSRIKQLGRVLYQDEVLFSSFTASGIEFKINGTAVKATMQGMTYKNALDLAVFVDGVRKDDIKIRSLKEYTLCENLSNGPHTIKLMNANEVAHGVIVYYDLRVTGTLMSRPAEAKRKLEFYGDSITCGHGVLAEAEGMPGVDYAGPENSDGLRTYASYTAFNLNADFNVISKSGAGVVKDGAQQEHGDEILISTIYDNYGISPSYFPTPKWKFADYTPDVVVINLGTNDSNSGRVSGQEIADGAKKLVEYMHSKYPKAKIVWAYGLMENKFHNQIKNAIEGMNVPYASYLQLPLMQTSRGNHPSEEAHKAGADVLTAYLKNLMNW